MTDWPMTFKCNNNCISCILDRKLTKDIPDPSLEQIKKVIDSLDEDNDYFGISGGEPTLRRELFDIIKYLRKKKPNIYAFMVSNGRMFAYRKYAMEFSKLPLGNFMIGITLYGSNSSIHDTITMVKGSFEQTVRGIKNLLDFGVNVELRTIINKINYKDMVELARFVSTNFKGIERFVFVNMKITGNAYKNRDKLVVKYSELVPYVERAADILLKNNINTRLYHFPLCMLDAKYIDNAAGVTKELNELKFAPQCEHCKMKKECPMIWKTYAFFVGEDEFVPIGDEYLFFYYFQKLIKIYRKYENKETKKRLKIINGLCKKYDVCVFPSGSLEFGQCKNTSDIDISIVGNPINMKKFIDELKKKYKIDIDSRFDINEIINILNSNNQKYNDNIKRLIYLIFSYETSFIVGDNNILNLINKSKIKLKKEKFWQKYLSNEFKIFLKNYLEINKILNLDKEYSKRVKLSSVDIKKVQEIENKLDKIIKNILGE